MTTAQSSTQPATPIQLGSCRKILVVKLDSLGDFLLVTPFLRGLRRAAPQAHIDLLVAPQTLPLAELCPYVNRVVGFQVTQQGVSFTAQASGAQTSRDGFLADFAAHTYDLAVVPRWDLDMGFASWVCRSSEAPRRVGFAAPRMYAQHCGYAQQNYTDILHRPFAAHEVEHYEALLDFLLGVSEPGRAFSSHPDQTPTEAWIRADDLAAAKRMLAETQMNPSRPLLAVCPGAAGANRRMPPHKLRAILRRANTLLPGLQFLVLGSAADRQAAEALRSVLPECASLCGRTTLRESVALLSRATAAVTMDSGPAHLAAAVETPVVVFSPHPRNGDPIDNHSPVRFGPWGRGERIVLQPEAGVWPCTDRCRSQAANCLFAIDDEGAAEAICGITERAWKRRESLNIPEIAPANISPGLAGMDDARCAVSPW